MKNLYDRLKKEYKYKLELEAIHHKDAMDSLVRDLKKTYSHMFLPYHVCKTMNVFLGVDINQIALSFDE